MPTITTADDRAEAGATFLDEKLPGWFLQINPRTLRLESSCHCVLGQLACDIVPRKRWFPRWQKCKVLPEYSAATGVLRLQKARLIALGFTIDGLGDDDGVTFQHLNVAWRKVIKARLAQ